MTRERDLPEGIERLVSGYRGRYWGPDRRRHSTGTYQTIRDAVDARQQAIAAVRRGDWIDPLRAAITLDRWMALWMPARIGVRPYVVEEDWGRYRRHIKPYLGNHELSRITPFIVQWWLSAMEKDGRTASQRFKAFTLLRTALGKKGAMGDERRRDNPCATISVPRPESPEWQLVTRDQFAALLAEMDERYVSLIVTAVYTGLRWSELVSLQRRHYNPLHGTITVEKPRVERHGKILDPDDPKGRRRRTVPLFDAVVAALNAHIAQHPMPPDGLLFTAPHGGMLHHRNFIARQFKPALEAAGLPATIRFHDLRHSCASWLLKGGMPIHEVMEIMGHAAITTTQLYAHTDMDEKRAALRKAFEGK